MKGFNVSFEYALYEISYANIALYSATIPSYDAIKSSKEGKKVNEKAINADDPNNRKKVEQILFG